MLYYIHLHQLFLALTKFSKFSGDPIEIVFSSSASAVEDKDLSSFSKDLTANDHVLTYLPLKNKSEYEDAYENWKKNLLNILNNKL